MARGAPPVPICVLGPARARDAARPECELRTQRTSLAKT